MITLGVGFSSGCSADELVELAMAVRAQVDAPAGHLASHDRKRAGTILALAAQRLALSPCYLSSAELARHAGQRPDSPAARAALGLGSVAEAAALAAVGPGARLVVPKTRSERATCAAAVA